MSAPWASPEFTEAVATARLADPLPTFQELSRNTGETVEDLIHYALVRWASAGSEALMMIEPQVLRDLIDARQREDWTKVAGMIDWLAAEL